MPGPFNRSSFQSCRFCATCEPQLYWPYHPNYAHCPQCGMATVLKSVEAEKVMTTAEAKRRVQHIEFNKYCDDETPEARAEREARAADDDVSRTRDEVSAERMKRFTEVISGAGFTKFEQDVCKAYERAMPPVNNPRYADPLAE